MQFVLYTSLIFKNKKYQDHVNSMFISHPLKNFQIKFKVRMLQ